MFDGTKLDLLNSAKKGLINKHSLKCHVLTDVFTFNLYKPIFVLSNDVLRSFIVIIR
jgi:hypothetical protein